MRQVLQPGRVRIRHIKLGTALEPGAVQVLGRWFVPQDERSVNGRQGFQTGQYERRLGEEGTFSITFANAEGPDGVLHADRFLVITDGKRIPGVESDDSYRPGDEWFEVYLEEELLFVGTPTDAEVTRTSVTLSGKDGLWLMNKVRDRGHVWAHAPRDVWEHYAGIWQAAPLDNFEDSSSYTYATTEGTSPNGKWRTKRIEPSPIPERVQMRLTNPADGEYPDAYLWGQPADAFTIGPGGDRYWRVEFEVLIGRQDKEELGDNLKLRVGLLAADTLTLIAGAYIRPSQAIEDMDLLVDGLQLKTQVKTQFPGPFKFAFEGRDRWVFIYEGEKLLGVLPRPRTAYSVVPGTWFRYDRSSAAAGSAVAEVDVFVRKRWRPFLLRGGDPGDLRLPGAPPPDGLIGSYYHEPTLKPVDENTIDQHRLLSPLIQPYHRRIDAAVNSETGSDFPPTPGNEFISVRWTGSIYLDLANYDYRLRTRCDDRARVWVGKTLFGDQIIDDWTGAGHPMLTTTGPWLRSLLGSVSGWFPIVVEFSNTFSALGMVLESQRGSTSDPWLVPGGTDPAAPKLSPLGCYENNVRLESHFEQLRSLMETFGIQATCAPRQLESGEFPGTLVPRVREGRDTDKIVEEDEATDLSLKINAEEVADILIADAAGLGDQEGGQITVENANYAALDTHLLIHEGYESLSEINVPSLVRQRLDARLALMQSPWEEVSARPRGFRELVDSFLLAGELAELAWEPGDGVRLDFPTIRVQDASPRQMLGVGWDFRPEGLGVPSAAFRQRPRSLRETLRRIQRGALTSKRNYQGARIVLGGSRGGEGGADATSRVRLPKDTKQILSGVVIVDHKSDTSAWNIAVNGNTVLTGITRPGHYDITPYVETDAITATQHRVTVSGSGGTGTIGLVAELVVTA